MQPAFLPWQGFFELIYESDLFIFLDDFQFSLQGPQQRNRLFVNRDNVAWCVVPIDKKSSFKKPLNETKIIEKSPWRKKMWKRIKQNYGKTPYFDAVAPFLKNWLLSTHVSLSHQNVIFIKYVCNAFGWKRQYLFSSSHPTEKKRSHRVLELLRKCGAKKYYCAHGSYGYMADEALFPVEDIEVVFQNYNHRPYKQHFSSDFTPYLSVLDAIFNIGFEETAYLIIHGTEKWLTWREMASLYGK